MVASRASASASRAVMTDNASPAAAVNATPRKPRPSLRAKRSSIRCVTPRPTPSSTSPATPLQNTALQRKPRRSGSCATMGTGSCAGSASGVIWIMPRAGRPASSASTTTTSGSSSRNVAGRRCLPRSVIAACLRSGTGGRGPAGYVGARVRPCHPAPAAAGGSAGNGNRCRRRRSRTCRESPRR